MTPADIELPEAAGYGCSKEFMSTSEGRFATVLPKPTAIYKDPIYTADQLRAAILADRAGRWVSCAEPKYALQHINGLVFSKAPALDIVNQLRNYLRSAKPNLSTELQTAPQPKEPT